LAEPRTLIGLGGFCGPPANGVVEIGYAIAPGHRGSGWATDAARQTDGPGIPRCVGRAVVAHTLAHTNGSTAVLTKLGFTIVDEIVDPADGPIWGWRKVRDS